jgi:hypothetical protein
MCSSHAVKPNRPCRYPADLSRKAIFPVGSRLAPRPVLNHRMNGPDPRPQSAPDNAPQAANWSNLASTSMHHELVFILEDTIKRS